ncbi:MAG: flagellar basal body rod protein FlgC [Proteobacteria bacterium]|nr:MAG: flagellar basal body rod protein FlgC [Pseudomonadota bacterium]
MDAMQISRSGLDVEWRRMEIIAQNIANMNTSRTSGGGSYVPLRVVSGPGGSFGQTLAAQEAGTSMQPQGVRIYGVEQTDRGVRRVHEPGHPHANANGFVSYPNVSHAEEMTLMVKTARAYEANLVAMTAAQQIYSSALQIGRQ